jgi:hypothetical protein
MKTEALSAFASKIAVGVATAATLAGSGALINATRTNAVQDQVLAQHTVELQKVDKLSDQLTEANINMVELRARLDQKDKDNVSSQ